jgi:hypothetical protein
MILVVGSGGSGQTYFMNFLIKNNIETNCVKDGDCLKHLSHPKHIKTTLNNPKNKDKKIKIHKCIFLYNDPLKSLLSHYRRDWRISQCNKLGNPFKLNEEQLELNSLLMQTIEKKRDLYGFEYQFDNWCNNKVMFPVLFLDFNEIKQNTEIINRFLGKELDFSLFEIKTRHNNTEKIDEHIQKIYNKLYIKIKDKSIHQNKLIIKSTNTNTHQLSE